MVVNYGRQGRRESIENIVVKCSVLVNRLLDQLIRKKKQILRLALESHLRR